MDEYVAMAKSIQANMVRNVIELLINGYTKRLT